MDEQSLTKIVSELCTDDEQIRFVAINQVRALVDTSEPNSLLVWLETLLKDAHPFVRKAAVFALGDLDNEAANICLISALADTDKSVKSSAAVALGSNLMAHGHARRSSAYLMIAMRMCALAQLCLSAGLEMQQ